MIIGYSQVFDPPAPVVEVIVQSPHNRRTRRLLPALIDTGSDVTAVPRTAIERLRVDATGQVQIAGLENAYRRQLLYEVQLRFQPNIRLIAEVIASDHAFVILGRDVLNQLVLRLDGPALNGEILAFHPLVPDLSGDS